MKRPIILVYGNCQSEAIATSLGAYPGIVDDYDIVYIPNYNITPQMEQELLLPELCDRVELLLEQVTPFVRLSNRFTFPDAKTITFPSLDCNLLWPLRADEPRMRPEPPTFPWGRFTYGDKIINAIVAEAIDGDAAWAAFSERSAAAIPNMERFAQIEERRWKVAEKLVDVIMSDVIFPSIREKRLFWTYNHPHRLVLCRLGARLIHAAGFSTTEEEAWEAYQRALSWPFGEDYHAPVHPLVAQQLSLEWWCSNMSWRRYDDSFSYEEFIRAQIAWR